MIKSIIIIFLVICATYSCTDKKDGDWDDNIKLSKKEFQFNSLENTAQITTVGDSWWISEIYFKNGQTLDLSDMDTTSKNFVITESQFTLERKGNDHRVI